MRLPKAILSEDEYLKFERAAFERHQFVDGEIFAMAGESGEHADITANTLGSFVHSFATVRAGPESPTPRCAAARFRSPRGGRRGCTPIPMSSLSATNRNTSTSIAT